jgi:hypothetical protein
VKAAAEEIAKRRKVGHTFTIGNQVRRLGFLSVHVRLDTWCGPDSEESRLAIYFGELVKATMEETSSKGRSSIPHNW